jgi:hypothetical protein
MDGRKNGTRISVPENVKPVKVSKFKSELESNKPQTSNTVLGDVKEVSSAPVVRDIISLTSNGFPKPKLSSKLNLGITKPKTKPQIQMPSLGQTNEVSKSAPVPLEGNDITGMGSNDYDENMKKILSMSPEEAQASIAQLSTMFSSENLDFLRSRGSQNSAPMKKAPSLHPPHHSSSPSSTLAPVNEDQKSYIAKDAHELSEQIKAAPSHVRRALQWTLDEDNDDDHAFENHSQTTSEKPIEQNPSSPKLLPSLRFDLQGCRIIHSGLSNSPTGRTLSNGIISTSTITINTKTTAQEWIEIFQKSFLGRSLSSLEIQNLVLVSLTMLLESGLVVEIPMDNDGVSEWVPELEHHEFDQGRPGYNLLETCEVF